MKLVSTLISGVYDLARAGMNAKAEIAEEIFDQATGPVPGTIHSTTQRTLSDLGLLHAPLYILSARQYIDLAHILSHSTMESGSLGNLQMRAGLQRLQLRIELVDEHGVRFEIDIVRLHASMSDTPFRAELQARVSHARQIRCRFGAPLFSVWSIDGNGLISIQTDPSIDFHKEPIMQILLTLEVIMQQVAKVARLQGVRFQLAGPPVLGGFCAFRGVRVPTPALGQFFSRDHSHGRSADLPEAPQFWCAATVDQSLEILRVVHQTHPARMLFESPPDVACYPRVGVQSEGALFFRIAEVDCMARLRAVAHRLQHGISLIRIADYTLSKLVRSTREVATQRNVDLPEAFATAMANQEPLFRSETATPMEYRMYLNDDAVVINVQLWSLNALRAAMHATCLKTHGHPLEHRAHRDETRAAQLKSGAPASALCPPAHPTCIGYLAMWDLPEADGAMEGHGNDTLDFAKLWAASEVPWAQIVPYAGPVGCAHIGCPPDLPASQLTFTMVYE